MTNPEFQCAACKYCTRNKYDWKKHLQTKKHLRNCSDGDVGITAAGGLTPQQFMCECGKTYKYYSGLSRHKLKCHPPIKNNKVDGANIVQQQRDQIATLQNLLEKTIESQQETLNNLMCKVGNTTNNNTVNNMQINFFLNKECKNAMNLTDFVDSLQLSLEDLLYT